MDRSAYLALRARVESEVLAALKDSAAAALLLNQIMRHVVEANAVEQTRRQRLTRELLTFRRNPDLKAPAWAFRKPGTVPVFTPNR